LINTLVVLPPLGLWMPYVIYRDTHLEHHRTSDLTLPDKDPESFYIPAKRWDQMGTAAQILLEFNNTLLGRLTIGPLITVTVFWFREARRCVQGDHKYVGVWLGHAVTVVAVLWWIVAVCEMPLWQYLVFFAWPGLSLTLLRSFLEHRPAAAPDQRTAIVEGTPLTRLLFLNNNYHTLHHEQPATPWYELRKIYHSERDRVLAKNGGYLYRDYGEVARRFLLKPKDHPIHPSLK
jgi:fatty acid desaturase